jgi:tetratricopeptide (TPR) repeat protein
VYGTGWGDGLGWLSALVLALLLAVFAWALARAPRLAFALGIVVLGLLPHTQLVRLAVLTAERYLYVPMIGVGLTVGLGLEAVRARRNVSTATLAAFAGVALAWIARDVVRSRDYQTPERYWQSVLDVHPDNAHALTNLGVLRAARGLDATVKDYFDRAVAADPDSDVALANLGVFYTYTARPDLAVPLLERAVALAPRIIDYRVSLANALLAVGRTSEARVHVDAILALEPREVRGQKLRRRLDRLDAPCLRQPGHDRRSAVRHSGCGPQPRRPLPDRRLSLRRRGLVVG